MNMGRGASSEGRAEAAEEEVRRIALRLVDDYWLYFTKDETINSDGARLLASALRYARWVSPPLRRALREALRRRDLGSFIKLLEALGLDDVASRLSEVSQGLPEGLRERHRRGP